MRRWRTNELSKQRKREAKRRYKANNPDKTQQQNKIQCKKTYAKNPQPYKERARARQLQIQMHPISKEDLDDLFVAQNGVCVYCPAILTDKKHLDHVFPLSRGGQHVIDNVQWTCAFCNDSKGAKTHEEFLGYRRAA
jgi:5-methylcytosine-specific restriction endonuclease McrA